MADVYISPSLQEFNTGWGNYGTEEDRMNMIGDVLEYELERHGLNVARNEPDMTLSQAVADSNAASPAVHVALHSNAANSEARGLEVYANRFGTNAERLARLIYDEIEAISPAAGMGVKEGYSTFGGKGMYELKKTDAPAALIEYAFHDNPEDARFIMDNIYELGKATAKGILAYFGIPYTEDTPENAAYLKSIYDSR